MLRKENSKGLLFNTRFGIHTFFLKKPIDVIILNNQGRAASLKKSLKPNRIFLWNPKHSQVLELRAGTIQGKKISKGDYIRVS